MTHKLGSVAKTQLGYEIPFPYLYLCGDTKDLVGAGHFLQSKGPAPDLVDEGDLSCHISSIDSLELSFADHRHRFVPFERLSSRIEGAEARV